jgi:hypothetical protein
MAFRHAMGLAISAAVDGRFPIQATVDGDAADTCPRPDEKRAGPPEPEHPARWASFTDSSQAGAVVPGKTRLLSPGATVSAVEFTFDVGKHELHRVSFSFDRMGGRLVIAVDGRPVRDELRIMSLRLVKRYQFVVGAEERHDVVIDKHRKLLFAGFRPQTCRAYVDGQLVIEQTA